jgi:hypothetical protein
MDEVELTAGGTDLHRVLDLATLAFRASRQARPRGGCPAGAHRWPRWPSAWRPPTMRPGSSARSASRRRPPCDVRTPAPARRAPPPWRSGPPSGRTPSRRRRARGRHAHEPCGTPPCGPSRRSVTCGRHAAAAGRLAAGLAVRHPARDDAEEVEEQARRLLRTLRLPEEERLTFELGQGEPAWVGSQGSSPTPPTSRSPRSRSPPTTAGTGG